MVKQNKYGFTLLELLVAMVLLSTVVLISVMALRVSVEAWGRGNAEGETTQIHTAVSELIRRQLDCVVKADPFAPSSERPLRFYGGPHGLSFFTAYAPQGSTAQGLLRVTYRFDEEEKTLSLFEKVITRREDLGEALNPLAAKFNNSYEPVSRVEGVSGFDVRYAGKVTGDASERPFWKDRWMRASEPLPADIGITLLEGSGSTAHSYVWQYSLNEDYREGDDYAPEVR